MDLRDEGARKAVAVEAKAGKRLLAHIAKGDERLFRRRRDTERCSGPALVLFDGCIVRDGVLRLPGGTEIPLPAGIVTVDDALASHQRGQGLRWGGAVHVVDVTDTAGKVTRRTGACAADADGRCTDTPAGAGRHLDMGIVRARCRLRG